MVGWLSIHLNLFHFSHSIIYGETEKNWQDLRVNQKEE